MFYIANLETRSILTYRDSTRIVYGSEALAKNHAVIAQEKTGHPHAVMHIANFGTAVMPRMVAPWLN